jgi:hypothetical protein
MSKRELIEINMSFPFPPGTGQHVVSLCEEIRSSAIAPWLGEVLLDKGDTNYRTMKGIMKFAGKTPGIRREEGVRKEQPIGPYCKTPVISAGHFNS